MSAAPQEPLPLIVRVERALLVLAYLIERDGDVYLPIFERLERDLAVLKAQEGTRNRAQALLDAYRRTGDVKAICSKNLSLSSSDGPRPYLGL